MTRDYDQFPDNDNGNVLWQMVEDGNDLSEPHEVEFSVVFEKQEQAEKCALHLLHQEQKISLYQEEQQRLAEEHLQEAADIGRISGISLEKLIELLTIFYQEED
jgi:hypothetical protein